MADAGLDHRTAVTTLQALRDAVQGLQLDDPALLRGDLDWIHGRVTALRAYAKRQQARAKEG